jgi:hypothetical protein
MQYLNAKKMVVNWDLFMLRLISYINQTVEKVSFLLTGDC